MDNIYEGKDEEVEVLDELDTGMIFRLCVGGEGDDVFMVADFCTMKGAPKDANATPVVNLVDGAVTFMPNDTEVQSFPDAALYLRGAAE